MKFRVWTLVTATTLLAAGSADAQTPNVAMSGDLESNRSTLLERPAKLVLRDVTLAIALHRLAEASGVPVAFSPTLVAADSRPVECECREVTVRQALDRMLSGSEFRYRELRGEVLVFRDATARPPQSRRSLYDLRAVPAHIRLAEFTPQNASLRTPAWRQGPIAGTVVDARSQRPLASVQVLVEGTQLAALTDAAGQFRFEDVAGTEVTLRTGMIGYRALRQTVRVGDTNVILALTESPIELEGIVVAGTPGGAERRAVGTVVGRVDAADIMSVAPVSNMGQLLNARVPGVVVMGELGVVGEGPRIRIRGRSSLSLKSDPIIYIDGIRVSNETGTGPAFQGSQTTSRLADIDPNQIESIEIIKGPAAATLYGTEASNGVIYITTKRGTPSARPVLTATIRQGANWFNSESRVPQNFNRDPATGELLGPFNIFASERAAGRKIFETGNLGSYGLSATGGSQGIQYYVATQYTDDQGVEPNNNLTRFSGRTNLDIRPSAAVDVSTSIGLIRQRTNLPISEAAICTICMVVRAQPILQNTPQLGFFPLGTPYAYREVVSMWQDLDRYTAAARISHRAGWFSQRLSMGIDQTSQADHFLAQVPRPEVAPLILVPQWRAGQKIADRRSIRVGSVDYGATATAVLTPFVESNTAAGFQYFGTRTQFMRAEGRNFPAPGLNAVTAAATTLGQEDVIENVTVGFYVQQQVSYGDRIYLTGAVRGDDNSAFGETFNMAVYPKVSASWVVSDERFWNFSPINEFRVRAAYGQSGQQPQNFAALQTYAATTARGGTPALTPEFIGNPDLGPERGAEFEAGFEAALFGDRAGVQFTYYDQRTKDVNILRQNAPSTGFPGMQWVNAGLITNKGVEVALNGDLIDSRTLRWNLDLNLSTNQNKVVSLDPDDPSFTFIPTWGENRIVEGFPISGHFKRRVVSARYNPETGRMDDILCDGGTGFKGLESGGPAVDCASAPRVYLGQAEPRWEGALTSSLTVSNRLQFRAQLDFKGGNSLFFHDGWILCTTYLICESSPGIRPEAVDPILAAESQIGADNVAVSSWVSKADFVKLRELSVSYEMPERWAARVGAARANIAVTARNLHTWTSYIGLDPESFRPHLIEAGSLTPYSYRDQGGMPSLASFQAIVTMTW